MSTANFHASAVAFGPTRGVLILGSSGSGKSRLALALAQALGGVIINADSMQVYDGLRVLTARPTDDEMALAPHRLYGHVDSAIAYSTGAWLRDVAALDLAGEFAGRRPIFVGGTGLYFRALTEGLSQMPEIPEQIRTKWRYRLGEAGPSGLHRELMLRDPRVAMKLRAGDGQRIVRALEVLEASGRSILDWQSNASPSVVGASATHRFVFDPDRSWLNERISRRFDAMAAGGAIDEVRALTLRNLDPDLPSMRAIGVPQFSAGLRGELPLEEAVNRAIVATRQYAKRQNTWFRNQLDASWTRLDPQVGDLTERVMALVRI